MSPSHLFRHRRWRHSIGYFGMVVALSLLAAVATFGVRPLFTSVASAKHLRYEPVDVPPQEVSPRHQKEREEYERREQVLTEKSR